MLENSVFGKVMKKILAAVAAFLAGAANGFFGGGGGMLVVPCLSALCALDRKSAHATAIAVVLPMSVLSAVLYMTSGVQSLGYAAYVGTGVVLGGALGAVLLKKVPKGVLTFGFYGVMIYAGVRMVLS